MLHGCQDPAARECPRAGDQGRMVVGTERRTGHHVLMERALTPWERAGVDVLASLDCDGSERVRESLQHLVVTGGCECGCASFNVRDRRYPTQPHELEHFSNGMAGDPPVGFVLWLGPDGRPISVDVDNERGVLPDPRQISVSPP